MGVTRDMGCCMGLIGAYFSIACGGMQDFSGREDRCAFENVGYDGCECMGAWGACVSRGWCEDGAHVVVSNKLVPNVWQWAVTTRAAPRHAVPRRTHLPIHPLRVLPYVLLTAPVAHTCTHAPLHPRTPTTAPAPAPARTYVVTLFSFAGFACTRTPPPQHPHPHTNPTLP